MEANGQWPSVAAALWDRAQRQGDDPFVRCGEGPWLTYRPAISQATWSPPASPSLGWGTETG